MTSYMTNDRIQLLNYALSLIPLINSPLLKVKLTDEETKYNQTLLTFTSNMSITGVINFIWHDLFTTWDRLLYEFENPSNFNKKEFKIITQTNLSSNLTYQNLLTTDNTANDAYLMYNLISNHVASLYNVFTNKNVKFKIFEVGRA